jgi:hypothetical protein
LIDLYLSDAKRSHNITEYRRVILDAGIGRWLWIDLFDKMSHALEMKQKSGSGGNNDLSISNVALKRMHSMQARASSFTKQTADACDLSAFTPPLLLFSASRARAAFWRPCGCVGLDILQLVLSDVFYSRAVQQRD